MPYVWNDDHFLKFFFVRELAKFALQLWKIEITENVYNVLKVTTLFIFYPYQTNRLSYIYLPYKLNHKAAALIIPLELGAP